MKKILLVEDEENFGSLLKNYLELSNYSVHWAKDGALAYSILMQNEFDLCILDVMMPNMDGFTLGQKIKLKRQIPFFYLTAKNQKSDILKGYKIGAEDYLTKPFDTDVLMLKIQAILNRSYQHDEQLPEENLYQIGQFQFTPASRKLTGLKEDVKLSPKESALLLLLCQYKEKVMPRERALIQIWNEDSYFTRRSMDVYIGKLRKYLKYDAKVSIETFHQMGFKLSDQI